MFGILILNLTLRLNLFMSFKMLLILSGDDYDKISHEVIDWMIIYIHLLRKTQNNNCTARQCSPLRRKFMECSVNSLALSLWI